MAWLQNLAGKAEDLLNKIDQNAATVLNEPIEEDIEKHSNNVIILPQPPSVTPPLESMRPRAPSIEFVNEISRHTPESAISDADEIIVSKGTTTTSSTSSEIFDPQIGSTLRLSSQGSSYNLLEDQNYEEQITKLESENQQLNKQILNLQHEYSELRNECNNLETKIESHKISAEQAHNEMEEYKIRAQRVLGEKEKLLQLNQHTNNDSDMQNQMLNTYNDELKKELRFQQDRNNDLLVKITNMSKEITMLQQQFNLLQQTAQKASQTMHENLSQERKLKSSADDECRNKTKQIQALQETLLGLQKTIETKESEIIDLKKHLKLSSQKGNDDVESRLYTLTQTLMHKQNTLETITSERNALKIQLEKLEITHNQLMNQKQRTIVNTISNSDDSRIEVPRLMEMSPLDAGVTRRVKHAYSTLDTISIRTGAFLRRYPLARIFVFCYMIFLHLWVLLILFTYVPSTR